MLKYETKILKELVSYQSTVPIQPCVKAE
uniref:Uncharacterized protein n=1 Tax=Rhizophora mucronata TaxID=61149 RepID=A0A2P2NX32_RHIMU